MAASLTALGAPTGLSLLHPVLSEILAAIEALVVLTVIGTALYGTADLAERAFRLLRWIANTPEPPAPGVSRSRNVS